MAPIKHRFIVLLMGISLNNMAQDIQKEIATQLWKPFLSTFNNLDAEGFLTLHSKDVVRSPRNSNVILNWTEYLAAQQQNNKMMREKGMSLKLDLRFTERIANDQTAIDVGIYRTTVTDKSGKAQSYYGRFHVVLRKENGAWKVLVDKDSSEGDTIGKKDFDAADPLE